MYMLAQGKHPFYQSKMTTEDYKRKIKTVIFPPLANSYFCINKDYPKISFQEFLKFSQIKDIILNKP